MGSLISWAEVALDGRAPGICPEFLKALNVVGLLWLTLFCNIAWMSGAVLLDCQTVVMVPGDRRVCFKYRANHTTPRLILLAFLARSSGEKVLVEPQIEEEQYGFHPRR